MSPTRQDSQSLGGNGRMPFDNMQKRASKDAHLCHNVVSRVKIIYIFHMLSYDYAKMNKF